MKAYQFLKTGLQDRVNIYEHVLKVTHSNTGTIKKRKEFDKSKQKDLDKINYSIKKYRQAIKILEELDL